MLENIEGKTMESELLGIDGEENIEYEENIKNIDISNGMETELGKSEVTVEKQNKFLESNLGKVINSGIDMGLRAVLPDFIEDEAIEIKDALVKEGLKEGINVAIENSIELGKSVMGMVTGTFETVSQAQIAIKKGGLLDNISEVINSVLKTVNNSGIISKNASKNIKAGKDKIIDSIKNNVEETFTKQIKSIEKIEKYSEKWQEEYENKNLEKMESNYKNIQKNIKEVLPLENIIKKARQIENLHMLIKSKNGNFEISDLERELASKLT